MCTSSLTPPGPLLNPFLSVWLSPFKSNGRTEYRDAPHQKQARPEYEMSSFLPLTLFAVGAALTLSVVFQRRSIQDPNFDPRAYVAAGALLLDVRTPAEFEGVHLAGAKNIPVGELSKRLDEVGSRETPVLVYCRSGGRSSRALGMLQRAGFEEARDLGAMGNW